MCQFPSTGILHFYSSDISNEAIKRVCVNSLLRVSCISTVPKDVAGIVIGKCQFPSTGILHFYSNGSPVIKEKAINVSIPFYGYLAFLHSKTNFDSVKTACVNSLLRVSCISTVSSQNPLKSRLPRLTFAGIYLNILTLMIFDPFFCLFKNCTNINTISSVLLLNFILSYLLLPSR